MGLDWGLYSALRQNDNFAQMRADRQADAAFLGQRVAMQQQKLNEQQQAASGVMDYLNMVGQMDFAPQDLDKVKAKEKELRVGIMDGLKQAGGDPRKFLLTGGSVMLKDYQNSLLQSDQVRNALWNKQNVAMFAADMHSGLRPHSVNGTPYSEYLNQWQQGKIDKLPAYQGASKVFPLDPLEFSKTVNPDSPYKPTMVTPQEYYEFAKAKGNHDEVARDMAAEYQQLVQSGGKPFYWGALYSKPMSKFEEEKISRLGKGGGKEILDLLSPSLQDMPQPHTQIMREDGSTIQVGTSIEKGNKLLNAIKDGSGISSQKIKGITYYNLPPNEVANQAKGVPTNRPYAFEAKGGDYVDISKGTVTNIENGVHFLYFTDPNTGQRQAVPSLKVHVNDLEHLPKGSEGNVEGSGHLWWETYSGDFYYPINVGSISKAVENKTLGVKDNLETEPPHGENTDEENQYEGVNTSGAFY